jgi:hypothetical protein
MNMTNIYQEEMEYYYKRSQKEFYVFYFYKKVLCASCFKIKGLDWICSVESGIDYAKGLVPIVIWKPIANQLFSVTTEYWLLEETIECFRTGKYYIARAD